MQIEFADFAGINIALKAFCSAQAEKNIHTKTVFFFYILQSKRIFLFEKEKSHQRSEYLKADTHVETNLATKMILLLPKSLLVGKTHNSKSLSLLYISLQSPDLFQFYFYSLHCWATSIGRETFCFNLKLVPNLLLGEKNSFCIGTDYPPTHCVHAFTRDSMDLIEFLFC
jgi:hypothetical protein